MPSSTECLPRVAAFVAGAPMRWSDLCTDAESFLSFCKSEDLSALCVHRLSRLSSRDDWPPSLCEALSEIARAQTAEELLRARETRAVLDAIERAGVRPILIK